LPSASHDDPSPSPVLGLSRSGAEVRYRVWLATGCDPVYDDQDTGRIERDLEEDIEA